MSIDRDLDICALERQRGITGHAFLCQPDRVFSKCVKDDFHFCFGFFLFLQHFKISHALNTFIAVCANFHDRPSIGLAFFK